MKNSDTRKQPLQFVRAYKFPFLLLLAIGTACVAEPYYGPAGPGPAYDYGYGGPAVYPWYSGADVDIVAGYGHGGGYGGWHGGRGDSFHGGGGHAAGHGRR